MAPSFPVVRFFLVLSSLIAVLMDRVKRDRTGGEDHSTGRVAVAQ